MHKRIEAGLKVKVALEAFRGKKTLAELQCRIRRGARQSDNQMEAGDSRDMGKSLMSKI